MIGTVWCLIAFLQASQWFKRHKEAVFGSTTNKWAPAWSGPNTIQQAFSHPGWLTASPLSPAAVLSSSVPSGSLPNSPFTPRRLPISRKQREVSTMSYPLSSSSPHPLHFPFSCLSLTKQNKQKKHTPIFFLQMLTLSIMSLFLDCHYLSFHFLFTSRPRQVLKFWRKKQKTNKKNLIYLSGNYPLFPFTIKPLEQYPKSTVPSLITPYLLLNQPLFPLKHNPIS